MAYKPGMRLQERSIAAHCTVGKVNYVPPIGTTVLDFATGGLLPEDYSSLCFLLFNLKNPNTFGNKPEINIQPSTATVIWQK